MVVIELVGVVVVEVVMVVVVETKPSASEMYSSVYC